MATKIGILSLGCARNLVDSEVIAGRLKQKGCEIIDLDSSGNSFFEGKVMVDAAVVNTCAFIKEAKEESVRAILDLIALKKQGKVKKIIVAGCLSQRYKQELFGRLPEVDAFLGTVSLNHAQKRRRLTPSHYAYVKICEGCVDNCSFCVIPRIKPKFTSRSPQSIISEARDLDKQGVSEINLIGQDISAYGWDLYREFRLTGLIKQILKNTRRISWVRMLYLSPARVSDGLLDLIAHSARIAKYVDLPLQHINDRILKLMGRDAGSSGIRRLIDKIRKRIPDAAIRTSLIVGFPTETEKEFKQLLEFVKEARFERLGLFMYSREESTKAYGFKGQVPRRAKEERYNTIMSCQREIAGRLNRRWRGKTLKVLIEGKEEERLYIGRSQHDAPEVDGLVYVRSEKELPAGSFEDVKIVDTWEYDLVGEAQ